MGLLDFFRRKALTISPTVFEAEASGQLNLYRRLGGTNQAVVGSWEQVQSANYAWIYRTQPAVRTVVDYIARNLSQLPLKLYERVSDDERESAGDHPAARTMRHPYPNTRPKGWIFDFAADYLIFDNAYAVKLMGTNGQRTLVRVPPYMMSIVGKTTFTVDGYRVYRSDGTVFPGPDSMLAPEQVIHWKGYNADDPRVGLSHLETLRAILAEEAASVTASTELLKSGLQKNGWVYRPLEAPDWGTAGREHFEQDLYNRVVRSDKRWPVLEEGMEIRDLGVTPKDAEMLKGREFTQDVVAAEYGMDNVPPEDEDERKQFYADILAPYAEQLAELLDMALLDEEYGATDYYFEFDLNEKLRGDPVARFAAITSAVGAPWLTREEARALENLSPEPKGDLITPMNVMVGDNPRPAPNVMPIQDPNGDPQDGSFRETAALPPPATKMAPLRKADQVARQERTAADATEILTGVFDRQLRATKSAKGKKAVNTEKWNKQLSDELMTLSRETVAREGTIHATRMATNFSVGRTREYLTVASDESAKAINDVTQRELDAAKTAEDIDGVFARAKNMRAPNGGMALATGLFAFSLREAVKQAGQEDKRIVSVTGGECPECDPYQGNWAFTALEAWPPYHPNCNCSVDIAS